LLDIAALKGIVHRDTLSQSDKLLLCLAVQKDKPKKAERVREIAQSVGLRGTILENTSRILSKSKNRAIRTTDGWELSPDGQIYVTSLISNQVATPTTTATAQLRSNLSKITDKQVAAFLDEAIHCLEAKLFRASVVLTWVGAVSILQQHVAKNALAQFNAEATRRDVRWKTAKTTDDLGRMKEHDFLEVICALSIIGNNVKQELEACLKLRNACGHPCSLIIGENKVAAHVETLILNVFSVFGV
jgi:hypothetical protein